MVAFQEAPEKSINADVISVASSVSGSLRVKRTHMVQRDRYHSQLP
jgi:hypothetical protein